MASSPKYYDRVFETSTTTGTGTYTLAGAISGYQSFAIVGNANSCQYVAFDVDGNGVASGGWEVGVGTYTTSGTTLSRDVILASSNANAAVSWAAGTRRVALTSPAAVALPDYGVSGFRLTTESGVPVSTSDRTSQGTLYLTPYLHNRIQLWNGSSWVLYSSAQISLGLTLTSGKNYDVFVYDNAGTLTLELSAAWTNDTTRADALTTQDGVTVKSGDLTRLWVGTIRASGSNVTEDSGGGSTTQVGGKRFVWNSYNQVTRPLKVVDKTDNWSYQTATWRQGDNASGNKIEYVCGNAAQSIETRLFASCFLQGTSGSVALAGIGLDSTTTPATDSLRQAGFNGNANGCYFGITAAYNGLPGLGYHYLAWLESGAGGSQCLFIGDNAGDGQQTGLIGFFEC